MRKCKKTSTKSNLLTQRKKRAQRWAIWFKKWHFRPLKEVFIACMERKEPDR